MSKPKYFSAEAREKIAATHRGRKQSPEQVAKRVEAFKKSFKPKPRTEEQRRAQSERQRGKKRGPCSEETKAKISASLTGRKLTAEHIAHTQAGLANNPAVLAWRQAFADRVARAPRSAEHRAKIGAAHKGRIVSAAARAKVSLHHRTDPAFLARMAEMGRRRRGVPQSAEHIAKVKAALPRGPQHYNWKGGVGVPLRIRFSDPRYEPWRRAVIEQCARTCQQCGRRCNRDGRGFHCHHLASYGAHPERRYDVENGVLYCGPCHRALHAVANKGAGRPAKGGQE